MFIKRLFLFHPGSEDGGQDTDPASDSLESGDVSNDLSRSGDQDAADDAPDVSEDVRRLQKALKAERDSRRELEKKLKSQESQSQTKAQTLEQRLAEIESQNNAYKLERARDKAIQEAVKAVEDGFRVDMESLYDQLDDLNVTMDNVSDVINRAVKRSTVRDTVLPKIENGQPPLGGAPKPKNFLEAPVVDWSASE